MMDMDMVIGINEHAVQRFLCKPTNTDRRRAVTCERLKAFEAVKERLEPRGFRCELAYCGALPIPFAVNVTELSTGARAQILLDSYYYHPLMADQASITC